jgi:hypothetical protein
MAAVEPQPILPREERNSWDRPMYDDRPGSRGDRGDRDRGDRPPRAPRQEESAETVGKD